MKVVSLEEYISMHILTVQNGQEIRKLWANDLQYNFFDKKDDLQCNYNSSQLIPFFLQQKTICFFGPKKICFTIHFIAFLTKKKDNLQCVYNNSQLRHDLQYISFFLTKKDDLQCVYNSSQLRHDLQYI